jgi:cell wall-associated NlpC family hydrolase
MSTEPKAFSFILGAALLPPLLLLAGCGSQPPARAPSPSVASTASVLTAEQGRDVAVHVLGLVGTPYRYGGNTPEGGFDCSGLIGYVFKQRAGLVPPRTVAALASYGAPLHADDLRTGDLVIFGSSPASHAGIYVGEGRFVHAPSTGGTVRLDRLDNRHWARQPIRFRRP